MRDYAYVIFSDETYDYVSSTNPNADIIKLNNKMDCLKLKYKKIIVLMPNVKVLLNIDELFESEVCCDRDENICVLEPNEKDYNMYVDMCKHNNTETSIRLFYEFIKNKKIPIIDKKYSMTKLVKNTFNSIMENEYKYINPVTLPRVLIDVNRNSKIVI